jgi:transposase
MPWQECTFMDERLKFIAGLLDGEKMAVLCRRFGVSRKTGYKILDRYNSCGLEGLTEWTEARRQRLEDELTLEGISAALQERELLSETDQLSDAEIACQPEISIICRNTSRGIIVAALGMFGTMIIPFRFVPH